MPCDLRTLPPCEIVGRASASTPWWVERHQQLVGTQRVRGGTRIDLKRQRTLQGVIITDYVTSRSYNPLDPASKLQLRTAPEWNRMCQ